MKYDVIIIGAGLSGLTAGSMLAKRGLKVALIDKAYNPGGSCGTFKRNGVTFDQGSSMLYGFGETGFNPHRFVFDALEEPIDMIRHDLLYVVHFRGHAIRFHADIDLFIEELAKLFPSEKENLRRFYGDMAKIYRDVMIENKQFMTPDETDPQSALTSFRRHPGSYIKFISFLNRNVKSVLRRYFTDPSLFHFFDKLTSTYCYTTTEETPAALAAVMFVDNHIGGSYYPAGSTVFLPGKLEKVIEENGGTMYMENEVVKIVFTGDRPSGVELKNGSRLEAEEIIYSGTVWNLYEKLLGPERLTGKELKWERRLEPTYPSVVLYALIKKDAIPDGTAAVEMLVGNPEEIDESEVTAYIPSVDDRTLCPEDCHVILAIGPSLEKWDRNDHGKYLDQKKREENRLLTVLARRFPAIKESLLFAEVATPLTIERFAGKNNGSVAGPKQKLGQHMFRRLHTRTRWDNLFCCGESTVMGTGTPAVTVSGLSAANAVLKKRGLPLYRYSEGMKPYVRIVPHPFTADQLFQDRPVDERKIRLEAMKCENCEHPSCMNKTAVDIRGILRRVVVGNFTGARRLCTDLPGDVPERDPILLDCETNCIKTADPDGPVEIKKIISYVIDGR